MKVVHRRTARKLVVMDVVGWIGQSKRVGLT